LSQSDIVVEVQDDESRAFAIALAQAADETKSSDITVLYVAPRVTWTSYMVFCTVFSKPQLLAVLSRMEKLGLEEQWDRLKQNQPGNSTWECLDFGSVLVHVMTPEQREYYDIESFYATCEDVILPFQKEEAPTMPSWTTAF
jgi:ribosome-associated protein